MAAKIVATDDEAARVWDARTHQLLFTLPHGDTVYDAVYSSDGTRLVTASGDGTVGVWEAADGTQLRVLAQDRPGAKRSRYGYVTISPDDKLIAAIEAFGKVAHVWDACTGVMVAELRNDAPEFPSFAFSGD